MSLIAATAVCFASALAAEPPVLDRPIPTRRTGLEFSKALQSQVSASWENVELRTILRRLGNAHQVSVLLDRYVDPNRELDLVLGYQPLIAGFDKVAKSASAEISVLGNTIFVGPEKHAGKLRTLEYLRRMELLAQKDRLSHERVRLLTRDRTVHWNDLDEPREIVQLLAKDAEIEILNPDLIPHDLWASATLPGCRLTEALSLILIQFDLTFAWSADFTQIRLVKVPENVGVEKPHVPPGGPSMRAAKSKRRAFLESAARAWMLLYPGLEAKVDLENHHVLVTGTLEQHEAIEGKPPAPAAVPVNETPTLDNRAFTLRIQRVRVIDLMKKLEESGVKFQYDAGLLAERNIDLEQTVNIDVKKADADKFFEAMFRPLGIKFSYQGHTVTLSPM